MFTRENRCVVNKEKNRRSIHEKTGTGWIISKTTQLSAIKDRCKLVFHQCSDY
jgi:hypothetical protein